jgi:SPP1 gp7 family putative phage head morphogenesis protein
MVDEAAAKIISKVSREFRHNRLAPFDELNVVKTNKHIKKLYDKVYHIVLSEFVDIANSVYGEIYNETVDQGFEGERSELDEGWVEEFLADYSPVTKFVFKNELDRKRARLSESILASKAEKNLSYKRAENLLKRQIKQSAIDLEDSIADEVYKDLGVEQVMWVAEDDNKTCGECNALDGQIFDVDEVPPKQHWHCRCYTVAVK